MTLLSVSVILTLLKKFIDRGLRLNDIFNVGNNTAGLTKRPMTLLHHLCSVRDYTGLKKKEVRALANKYSGGLGASCRFIDGAIELMAASRAIARRANLGARGLAG